MIVSASARQSSVRAMRRWGEELPWWSLGVELRVHVSNTFWFRNFEWSDVLQRRSILTFKLWVWPIPHIHSVWQSFILPVIYAFIQFDSHSTCQSSTYSFSLSHSASQSVSRSNILADLSSYSLTWCLSLYSYMHVGIYIDHLRIAIYACKTDLSVQICLYKNLFKVSYICI